MPDARNQPAEATPKQGRTDASEAVGRGCPNCGYEEINVPRDFTEQTEITCPRCDYSRPHPQFFGVPGGND